MKKLYLCATCLSYQKRNGRRPETISVSSSYKDNAYNINKITQSKTPKYIKERCFLCRQIKSEKLHICMSSYVGEQIGKIVKESNNEL